MITDSLKDVSRETMEQLRAYEALVQKWTKKINLVSSKDAGQIWERHIVDSIQIYSLAPDNGDWLDIGSGGGFPGIVAAILAKRENADRSFTLIDSDQRKCAFLRTAARELGLNVKVHAERVEKIAPLNAKILSARALDSLDGLLAFAELHLSADGIALFPKGANWEKEHDEASENWTYQMEVIQSETNPEATILKIKELSRA
ncbi:16S rRNA (guanine(527)-N(7))-methyltransferase RsmG [Sulfitobacter donghicola]|uniref:Ribosomal RNA small subunit methyltransferase G n=1 Tax=Sulfitobacter donghicola DSW-25 = KCTC 12864 = JCM 14565 TaxID=1300350 RepID=A0A073IM46_9RHOB|nr:16S rRNA (guanine(527)-N(7))-methyltransferase RsmG [Sulfitobacter donghicola]KEJ90650.1 16S rRNA methyltransferase [Sulfitobacter donghicola DSW-25 = KCTC 12864 = JCM 14565]KIN67899.1 Ribosomal RNA small subunit methyltransferase G [Sulfitobacter donghicola DSW-25 = KCTC 12864 = JCM 14565]